MFLLISCIFAYILIPVSAFEDECGENGWLEINGKCYYFANGTTTTVDGARSKCIKMKARLPMFSNLTEYTAFNKTVTEKYRSLTIPLGLQSINGQWTWTADGADKESIYWLTGAAAPKNEPLNRCVVRMADSGWKAVICDKTTGVSPVCQKGLNSLNQTEIPCTELYRFSNGWDHIYTTSVPEALERGYRLNQTHLMGPQIYVPTIHVPGITKPLYEVQYGTEKQSAIVNSEEDINRLLQANYTIKSIVAYMLINDDLTDVAMRHLTWSKDPPGDSVISNDADFTKHVVNYAYKTKDPLYAFDKEVSLGKCRLHRNCQVSYWSEWSECSATCGNSSKIRNRTITVPAVGEGFCPSIDELVSCDLDDCPLIQPISSDVMSQWQVDTLNKGGLLDTINNPDALAASLKNTIIPGIFANYTDSNHEIGHQLNETIQLCIYDDKPCDLSKLIKLRANPFYGNCFTFNPNPHELNVSQAGPKGGLRLMLKVQQSSYWGCSADAGFKVHMHPPDEYPFVETYGYSIAPGLLTSMAISMITQEKIDTPNNQCTDSKNDPLHPGISYYYSGVYTPEGCTKSCLQDYVMKKCQCADPRYGKPSNQTFCPDMQDPTKTNETVFGVKTLCPEFYQNSTCVNGDFIKMANCKCISQCKRIYFDAVINTAQMIVNTEMMDTACEDTNHTEGCRDRAGWIPIICMNTYILGLSRIFQPWDLFQEIANMLGNINGFDFFAVFEVAFLIAEIFVITCIGKSKKGDFSKSRIPLIRLLADDTNIVDFMFFLVTFCGSLMLLAFIYATKILEIRW